MKLIDFMPPQFGRSAIIRTVEGIEGEVSMEMALCLRLDYGSLKPWLQEGPDGFHAVAGPDRLHIMADVPVERSDNQLVSRFKVTEGQTVTFVLWYAPSETPVEPHEDFDASDALRETENYWRDWVSRCQYEGDYRDEVLRSLLTLKALTFTSTGGIVAAATTSLPEDLGGVRNWDYRFCWIRDSSLILQAFLRTGYHEEARQWHDWLLRAVAGDVAQMHIMYGIAGERRLPEIELEWLPGYENSKPVRIGNEAADQFQLDVYGEIMTCFYLIQEAGLPTSEYEWGFLCEMMDFLETAWEKPDESIWEVRGKQDHFTYSKFMCWIAFDRAIEAAERFDLPAPLEKWKKIRARIHEDICTNGFNKKVRAFTQAYGSEYLDASVLRMPLEGFLPPDDPRIIGTVEAIEEHLINNEFVFRYYPSHEVDGLPGEEGAFIMCSFWLVDVYLLMGREDDARRLHKKLLRLQTDLGLLSEEYEPHEKRLIGNFPQGLSHTGLILSAHAFSSESRAWGLTDHVKSGRA